MSGASRTGQAGREAKRPRRQARRVAEAGFTLVELLVYMGLLSAFLGTVAGADMLARRMYRRDAALIAGLQARESVFQALADDFARASEVELISTEAEPPVLVSIRFEGGATYGLDAGASMVYREGKPLTGNVRALRVRRADGLRAPVYHVEIETSPADEAVPDEADLGGRTFRRTFVLAAGASEGGAHAGF